MPGPTAAAPDAPLAGVRVLDLSRVLAGPVCSMILGDLGADVVKVERPGAGDDTRRWAPPEAGGESAYYLCANRSKRGITLDLTSDRGGEVALALAGCADVLLENFLVGWMDRHGLGYDALSQRNPRLIFCSLTGYGQTGPDAHLPGYDYLVQGRSGLMSITGHENEPPVKVGVAVSDLFAGHYALAAILAALYARERTGKGQRLDIALYDSQLASLANVASNYLVSGSVPQRYGNGHPNIVPYCAYMASDRLLILAVGNDVQWEHCCRVLGHPEWSADPRFATNSARVAARDELDSRLETVLATRPAADWVGRLQAAGVPAGLVNDVGQALTDPQAIARGMVVRLPHPSAGEVRLVGSPLQMSGTPVSIRRAPPLLGEHTAEVLADWLGCGPDEVAALAAAGAI